MEKKDQSPLFRLLTRIFSGPIVSYRKQQQIKFRRKALDNYSSYFSSASKKEFLKTSYNPYENLYSAHMANHNRSERYVDFNQMEFTPEISSALDLYADEMTTSNEFQKLLKIECPNEEIKEILRVLYYDILNIEFTLFGWCRAMCKYGDFFLYIDVEDGVGVKHALGIEPHLIERLEGEDPTNPNYIQYQMNSAGQTFENWQIAHFRILGNEKYAPYGSSVLESARRIWRQLTLIEDAMMSYRIVRAPERRVFYVDVGNIAPQDIEQHMLRFADQMKKNQIIDPDTGRVDLRYNPMSVEEDYFVAVRGQNNGTKIDVLPGGTMNNDIQDVKYLRDKLFSALKVPQSYLSRSEQGSEDKTTLAQKDIMFARTVQRLQRAIISELEKIGAVHLLTLGFHSEDVVNFKLSLNNPSQIAEIQQLEQLRTKFETATNATDGLFSRRWISKNIFNMSDQEFKRNQREMFYDRKIDADLQSIAASEEGGGGGGGFTSSMTDNEPDVEDFTGEIDDTDDLEGETIAPEEEPEGALPNEPPAKREGMTTTPASNGKWYEPVKTDKRDMGARLRSYGAQYSKESGVNTPRNTFKGLSPLTKGIYENPDTNYNLLEEEKQVFKANTQIQKIVEDLERSLEKKNEKKAET